MELMNWVMKPLHNGIMWVGEKMFSVTIFKIKLATWMWVISILLWCSIIGNGIESSINKAYDRGYNDGIKLTEVIK